MSEYLSEEEQVDRLKSWWDENGTSVIVGLVIAVVGIGGWQWYGSHSQEQMFDASRAYNTYVDAAEADKPAAAEQLASTHGGSAYHVFVLFEQARSALNSGDLGAAEGYLNEVIAEGQDVLLVDLAKVRVAKIQQALDRSSEALATLDSVSNEGYRAWGLEAKGDIHVSRGELELAHAAYQAAMESISPGDQRPLLEMKLNNVAPFQGEHVQFADTLESALQAAQETLDEVVEASPVEGGGTASTTETGAEVLQAVDDSGLQENAAEDVEAAASSDEDNSVDE